MPTIGNEKNALSINDTRFTGILIISAFLVITFFTYFFVREPMISWTLLYYLILLSLIVFNCKSGLIVLGLSYHVVVTSFQAITGNYHTFLFYGLFIAALTVIFYSNILGFRIRIPSLLMDKYVLIMIFYLAFSVVFITPEKSYGSEKFRTYLTNAILFYIPILIIRGKSDFRAIAKGMVYFGVLFTGFCLISYFDLEPFFGGEIHGRFSTLGLNTIWVARYLTYAILAELYLIRIYSANISRNIGKISLLVLLITIQSYLTFLTGSRGPLLSIIVALLFVVMISVRLRFSYLVIIALVSVLVFFAFIHILPSHIADRILTRDPGSQVTVQIRLAANLQALNMFWNNKVLGAGLGSFRGVFPLRFPHNVFTETLGELGAVGFTIFMAILISGVSYLIKMSKKIDKSFLHLMIALLITSVVNINFGEVIGGNFYLYFSLGLIYAARVVSLDDEVSSNGEEDYLTPSNSELNLSPS